LERSVASWEDEAERTAAELAELEESASSIMDADDPRAAARERAGKAMELRFLIDGARAAAEKSRLQLRDAREELALAQAAEKRQEAAKLTAEADELQGKLDELLRQLTALDGATYVPEAELGYEERQAVMLREGRYVVPPQPRADVLRDEAAALIVAAERLEQPVFDERRARAEREAPLVPSASILVPAWDDIDSDSHLTCRVSEGVGSATFEAITGGQHGGVEIVTLPDEQGRRIWGKRVKVQAGGGGAEIRCNDQVLAKEVRPGQLMNDGMARWWVDAIRCPGCRQLAPVTKRAPSPTSSQTDGSVLAIDCQNGCDVRPSDLAGRGQR
jgi:hypothetical protein